MATVEIIMGSKSDLDVARPAATVLKEFGVDVEVKVLSAHRTPSEVSALASSALERGVRVIIAVAGKAAHLAGFIAASTPLPVIGLPVKSSFMDGMDSLLSTVMMPNGVPVATVAVNGGQNAGLLALQMLSLGDKVLMDKLIEYKQKMREKVIDSNEGLEI
ncbi:MAG: 5-(carboxyamino)imidazole ribonucleotide mutase [Clostridiales bacterium]|nr:5-(carboxyamino)imidazole ribonucleotide mutase [Clostridiales bacterium]